MEIKREGEQRGKRGGKRFVVDVCGLKVHGLQREGL